MAQRGVVNSAATLAVNPLAITGDQQSQYAQFQRSAVTLRPGENRLYGGDFEDLGQMTQFGWLHVSHDCPGIESSAKLSATRPKHGRYCLELSARAAPSAAAPPMVCSAPVWIESPPMSVVEGQVVEITGWVRIDGSITGSVDGLQIVDSLGGPELALSVRQTSGWQPFQLIRGVPESSELRLTFALSGLGAASIDGVMVRTLDPPVVRRLPAVSPADAQPQASSDNVADNAGPLLVAPGAR
jgi:hypothetical protein